MRRSVWTIVVLMLVVSGCSEESRPQSVTATSMTTSTATGATGSTTSGPGRTTVVLGAGGVFVTKEWRFGSDAKLVLADLERTFGTAPKTETMDCEAGTTELHTWPALTALMQDGKFDGWSVPGTSKDLRTNKGIGIGSRRSDLLVAYPDAEVVDTSLGTEWSVEDGEGGFLAGLLERDAPSAAVIAMWSGNACIFR